jgi:hypothetical protein
MRTLASLLVMTALLGCGKAGAPHPPIPQIPKAAVDLVVAQQGPTLLLSFSFPTLTEAGTTLRSVEKIRVFRVVEELPATATAVAAGEAEGGETAGVPPALALFSHVAPLAPQQFNKMKEEVATLEGKQIPSAIAGGRVVFRDQPPLQTIDARPVRIDYAISFESDEAEGRLSNIASLVPLGVPLPPRDLTAQPQAPGVLLNWTPPSTTIVGGELPPILGYNIYRNPPAGGGVVLETPVNEAPVSGTEYRDVPLVGTYSYAITAVTSTKPQRSESEPVMIGGVEFRDLVPPPVPAEVDTLVEERAVRILWDPVEGGDVAGYKVYRRGPMPPALLLTQSPITETTFTDADPPPGVYNYLVTSVDTSGNESPPGRSEEVTILEKR